MTIKTIPLEQRLSPAEDRLYFPYTYEGYLLTEGAFQQICGPFLKREQLLAALAELDQHSELKGQQLLGVQTLRKPFASNFDIRQTPPNFDKEGNPIVTYQDSNLPPQPSRPNLQLLPGLGGSQGASEPPSP